MVVKNENIKEVFWYLVYSESYEILANFKSTKIKFFFTYWPAGNENSKKLKNDKVNKHIQS